MLKTSSYKQRKRAKWLCVSLLFWLVLLAPYALKPFWLRIHASILLKQLHNCRKQETCDALLKMLDEGDLPQSIGDKVLQEVARPTTLVRSPYLEGGHVFVALRRGAALHAQHRDIIKDYELTANGETLWHDKLIAGQPIGVDYIEVAKGSMENGVVGLVNKPGVYHATLTVKYAMTAAYKVKWVFPIWLSFPLNLIPQRQTYREKQTTGVAYSCVFVFPLNIIVKPKRDVTCATLTSNPHLDALVQQSFSVNSVTGRPLDQSAAALSKVIPSQFGSQANVVGAFDIRCSSPPIDLCLRAKFRDHSGKEFVSSVFGCCCKCGETQIISMLGMPDIFNALPSGKHEGDLILYSDRYLACEDPLITNIWSGSVSFPIRFTIN